MPQDRVLEPDLYLPTPLLGVRAIREEEEAIQEVDASPVGIFVSDADERILYANSLSEQLFGEMLTGPDSPKCGNFISCPNCMGIPGDDVIIFVENAVGLAYHTHYITHIKGDVPRSAIDLGGIGGLRVVAPKGSPSDGP